MERFDTGSSKDHAGSAVDSHPLSVDVGAGPGVADLHSEPASMDVDGQEEEAGQPHPQVRRLFAHIQYAALMSMVVLRWTQQDVVPNVVLK